MKLWSQVDQLFSLFFNREGILFNCVRVIFFVYTWTLSSKLIPGENLQKSMELHWEHIYPNLFLSDTFLTLVSHLNQLNYRIFKPRLSTRTSILMVIFVIWMLPCLDSQKYTETTTQYWTAVIWYWFTFIVPTWCIKVIRMLIISPKMLSSPDNIQYISIWNFLAK